MNLLLLPQEPVAEDLPPCCWTAAAAAAAVLAVLALALALAVALAVAAASSDARSSSTMLRLQFPLSDCLLISFRTTRLRCLNLKSLKTTSVPWNYDTCSS